MLKMIANRLAECHLNFPAYGARDENDLKLLAKMFLRHIEKNGLTSEFVDLAFDHHLEHGKDFPKVSDILDLARPITVYRMNNGPEGWGAVYHADHPYIRLQTRTGTRVSDYAETTHGVEALKLRREALLSGPCGDDGEDEPPRIERDGPGGFRRIDYKPPRLQ